MKKWKTINKFKVQSSKFKVEDLIEIVFENRGLKTKKEIDEFLNPKLSSITINNLTIDPKQLNKAVLRIKNAIKKGEKIVVFGDYDVDGICGTAILWETLNSLGAKAMPYIPHRIDEGYGLSIKGIQNVMNGILKQVQDDKEKGLIITVDNGIVANKAVEFANKQGIDVVITDHHVPSKNLPNAYAIVHTTKLCGAGVAWMLSNVILNSKDVMPNLFRHLNAPKNETLKQVQGDNNKQVQHDKEKERHLELVALATVADLVPLVGANRTLVKIGVEHLRQTKRIGLLELFKESGLDKSTIGVYEIGHIIAPRINAMGRLDYAMDSLRLLCTNNRERARKLAQTLGSTNRERQTLTIETVENAKEKVKSQNSTLRLRSGQEFKSQNLLFIADKSYQQGIIGLVAGKLVEEYYKPSIVVSIGEKYSKASARSVSGFNIIEFIRSASELLVDAGGHPMAAGFTVETTKLSVLQKIFEERANELLDEDMLKRTLRIDCNLPLEFVSNELYDAIQKLSPFGMGNPEPTFVSRGVVIEDLRVVGKESSHLKLVVSQKTVASRHSGEEERRLQNLSAFLRVERDSGRAHSSLARMTRGFDAIAFGMGERASEFHIGDKVDMVYTIDEDSWNGDRRLQLKIRDLRNVY